MDEDISKINFTDAPWDTPKSDLSAEAYCSVCLIDDNSDAPKVKSKCHLPIRSTPGGPVNKNALRNAAARLDQVQSSPESKASARRKLVSLMQQAGIKTSLAKDADGEEYISFALEEVAALARVIGDPVSMEAESGLIFKSNEAKRLVYGVSYPAKPLGWSDTQDDWISTDEIESMAHRWMMKSQQYDEQHKVIGLEGKVFVVQSYIPLVDFSIDGHVITKGSWVTVTYIPDDEIWNKVTTGKINAYSIRGKAKRKPLIIDDSPSVIPESASDISDH